MGSWRVYAGGHSGGLTTFAYVQSVPGAGELLEVLPAFVLAPLPEGGVEPVAVPVLSLPVPVESTLPPQPAVTTVSTTKLARRREEEVRMRRASAVCMPSRNA